MDKMPQSTNARPSFIHGTNDGAVVVPCNGPGEMRPSKETGKPNIVNQNFLKLHMEQNENMGGYRK